MLDLASVVVSLALFAVFVGGLPLVVITLAVIAMAAFDLWRDATGRS